MISFHNHLRADLHVDTYSQSTYLILTDFISDVAEGSTHLNSSQYDLIVLSYTRRNLALRVCSPLFPLTPLTDTLNQCNARALFIPGNTAITTFIFALTHLSKLVNLPKFFSEPIPHADSISFTLEFYISYLDCSFFSSKQCVKFYMAMIRYSTSRNMFLSCLDWPHDNDKAHYTPSPGCRQNSLINIHTCYTT